MFTFIIYIFRFTFHINFRLCILGQMCGNELSHLAKYMKLSDIFACGAT